MDHLDTSLTATKIMKQESYGRLFLRFLKFGFLAWGGPVAQIAMIRQELVEEEKWISKERFNRVLAVYQVLPGPEAHELCVYFGMLARKHLGGFLAGLGFMLPGFIFMFILSWLYATFGIASPLFRALFSGCQAAVVALIIRAVHRIGRHALLDRLLWGIAVVSGAAYLLGLHFLLVLLFAGGIYVFLKSRLYKVAIAASALLLISMLLLYVVPGTSVTPSEIPSSFKPPSLLTLFGSGLRGGLLTFGGAYTVLPFLQHDAVRVGGWMTNSQFLDGIALSGILPAPFIIFSTFVGYLGGGPWGALVLTTGIFLPAFAFTLVGHNVIERLIEYKALHAFLDGVTAGVVGLITATTIGLFRVAVVGIPAFCILVLALLILYRWKAKGAVAVVMLTAGILGLLFFQ